MKTHDLLCSALVLAGMNKSFRGSGPQPGLVFPHGRFTRRLRAAADSAWAQMHLAASDLGVARVELTLLLGEAADDAMTAALYEEVDFLWATGYSCHFSRQPDGVGLQVKAHVFISPSLATDEAFVDDIPTVADEDELVDWLRLSLQACRRLVAACAKTR